MHKMETLDLQDRQLLVDAYRIFFDATDYDPQILIGYCRLAKDILGNETENTVCDIVLFRLIKMCTNFRDEAQIALDARYGLSGNIPLSFEMIGKLLFITPSSAQQLCLRTLNKLRSTEVAKQYNVKLRKSCLNQPSAFAQNHNISTLNLSTRCYNALSNAGILTIKQFILLTPETLNNMRGIGNQCIQEILEKQKSLSTKNT